MRNCVWDSSRERVHACNCIGPQNGNPVCPCAMRSVTVQNGRYVQVTDLGPVPERHDPIDLSYIFAVEGRRNGID